MRYVFPSVGGLCVMFLYNIVDGIFIGQGVGSAALGAVNIAVPFMTAAVALVSMMPMGGATIIAIRTGQGDKAGANQAFMSALTLTVLLSVIMTVIGMVFAKEIVLLCGGRNLSHEMVAMAEEYLFYFMAFCIFNLMSLSLSVFVRNDGSPTLSFVAMCTGAVANIVLDWLFIFPLQWGVIGAAVASGLGQVSSCLILMTHFIRRKGDLRIRKFPLNLSLMGKICTYGLPESASQLTTPVTTFCYNTVLASMIGDLAVSTFSVLSFIFSLVNAILSGVVQGMQPLWGRSYGMKDDKGLRYYFRTSLWINIIASAVMTTGLTVFAAPAIRIFNNEPALVESGMKALPVFALSFVPMAINYIVAGYYFSIQKTLQANVLSMSRGVVLKAIAIFAVPLLLGQSAVWYAPLVAEMLTLAIAAVIIFNECRKRT